VGDLTEAVLKDRLDVDVFLHSVDAGHARSNCPNSWVDAPSGAKRYPVGPKARKSAIYQGLPPGLQLLLAQFIEYVELFLRNWLGRPALGGVGGGVWRL
jgi:hypothetical protein